MTSIAMLFCFPVQNFNKIGQSAAELRPKTIFNMVAVNNHICLVFLENRVFCVYAF